MGYRTNKFNRKAKVEEGGWTVGWSADVAEVDVLDGVVAGGVSIATSNPGPFITWITSLVNRTISSLASSIQQQFSAALIPQAVTRAERIIRQLVGQRSDGSDEHPFGSVDFKAGAITYSGENTIHNPFGGDIVVSKTWGMKLYVAFRLRTTHPGSGNSVHWEDEYLVGDWDGNGTDTLAVRRGNQILYQPTINSATGTVVSFGNGNGEDQYLVGDWDGDGRDTLAVRRGNQIWYQPTINSTTGILISYGDGDRENEYLVGKWVSGGRDTFAIRRGNRIFYQPTINSTTGTAVSYGND